MNPELIPTSEDGRFRFTCSPEVPCFNECCRNLNQYLTPYDIVRLKSHLELTSGQFLEQYTSWHIGPGSGLPIITLTRRDPRELTCPFVTDKGCRVYENRPSSCRIYPVMRAAARSRATGEMTERYMLLRESHCRGFCGNRTWSVKQWMRNQEVLVYNEINDRLMQIISLKSRLTPGPLADRSCHLWMETS